MPSMFVSTLRPCSLQIGQQNRAVVSEYETHAGAGHGIADAVPIEFQCGARAGRGDLHPDSLNSAPILGRDPSLDDGDFLLAIDAHVPAAFDQKQREVLGEGFEAAVSSPGLHAFPL